MANEIPKMDSDQVIATTLDTYFGTTPHKHHNQDTDKCSIATHEQLCNQALKHYEELAGACGHRLGLIPKAIEFYKEYGNDAYQSPRLRAIREIALAGRIKKHDR